ncbi:MAG TPA: insulinase family protein, partial [Rhabdochlamydiaceae bacterium]|nr:insulinase family protein [Rhabdochlamydiaceae bacterium]
MFQVGERYKDFLVQKVVKLDELQATLLELEHVHSGAIVMQIENDDPENLFCLSFQTLPSSSNGVAHILEHTVLCGSRKFPVKDPFFAMTRRSLNTFMNALTGADFTCYPAASQVEKDFYNLLDVYLDAVFHPHLRRESFLQEGHRLELTNPKDLNSPLVWKGVVYNEMKGAMAPADTRLWHTMMAALVPDLTYSHVSGGDPAVIPSLTYEELIHFHETYYHPSRCLFFFYGNLPLKHHLDFIEERVLKSATQLAPLPALPRQKRFKHPLIREGSYPVSEDDVENMTMTAWGWLT